MSNSPLVTYTALSPNCTKPRNHTIDTVTVHCMAGNLSVETCGRVFATYDAVNGSSSNYGIGSDGRIAMYVEEKNRSWCSSSRSNDHRAITIEVANSGGAPDWPVSDKAYASLLDLLEDVCSRNNIKQLLWKADPALVGQIEQQNMTAHRWFKAKACPGNYLYNRHYAIAAEVNRRLLSEEDDMAAIIEQIAQSAGLSTADTIKALGVVARNANLTADSWEKEGVAYLLNDTHLISSNRDANVPVVWGELGVVLKRFKEKFIK